MNCSQEFSIGFSLSGRGRESLFKRLECRVPLSLQLVNPRPQRNDLMLPRCTYCGQLRFDRRNLVVNVEGTKQLAPHPLDVIGENEVSRGAPWAVMQANHCCITSRP